MGGKHIEVLYNRILEHLDELYKKLTKIEDLVSELSEATEGIEERIDRLETD